MTLDFCARSHREGLPLQMSAPAPGAVAPLRAGGGVRGHRSAHGSGGFRRFPAHEPAQQALAEQRRHPIRADVPAKTPALKEVAPDGRSYSAAGELLADYRAVFGG
jgi:hypothetical protein